MQANHNLQRVEFEKMVTDDVKRLAGDYVAGDPTAMQRAVDAEITINVGLALRTYFKPEHFDRYSEELQKVIAKKFKEAQL